MNIQPVLKVHYQDKWAWFFTPNIMILSVLLLNVIISLLLTNGGSRAVGISYLVIYMFVMGILVVTQTFPYVIGMSIRRTDYFFGTVVMAIVMNICYGIMLLILTIMENATNGWGLKMRLFHFPYLNDGTILEQLTSYVILLIHFFFLGFLFSSLGYRYGKKGMFITVLVAVLLTSLLSVFITHQGYWLDISNWVSSHTAVELAYWLMIPTLIYIFVPYKLLRKAII